MKPTKMADVSLRKAVMVQKEVNSDNFIALANDMHKQPKREPMGLKSAILIAYSMLLNEFALNLLPSDTMAWAIFQQENRNTNGQIILTIQRFVRKVVETEEPIKRNDLPKLLLHYVSFVEKCEKGDVIE
jgi:hypothetical protein